MNDSVERAINRVYNWAFPILLAILGYLIQDGVNRMEKGISDMSTTLKSIQGDVQAINQDALLFKQKVNFRLEQMERRIDRLEPKP